MRAVVYARVSTEHGIKSKLHAIPTGKLQRSMWIRASQERRRRKGRSSYV